MLKRIAFEELDFGTRQLCSVVLTPEQAAELLTKNVDNRRLRVSLVKYLIRQIQQQEWRGDHPQPIVFSKKRLLDGQHRLTAISQSGWDGGCLVRIETGADDSVRQYLDTGVSRSLADRVSVVEDRAYNEWIMKVVNANTDVVGQVGKRPTPEDAREYYDTRKIEMEAVYRCWKKVPLLGVFPVVVAAVEYAQKDIDKAIEFYADYFTPAGKIHQAQLLRDAVLREGGGNRGCTQRKTLYQRAVTCMKAHLEGRSIKRAVTGAW